MLSREALSLAFILGSFGCGPSASAPAAGDTGSASDAGITEDGGVACPVGSEGCGCTDGGGCDPGLTCLSNLCVELPGTTTDTATGSDQGPGSTPTSSSTGPPPTSGDTSTSSGTTSDGTGTTGPAYSAVGPQTNVALDEVVGWEVCWSGPYRGEEPAVDEILEMCDGDELMLACRHDDDDFYTLLAHAPRDDVLMEQPYPFTPHVANGAGWYFWVPDGVGEEGAWGFVNAGDTTAGGVCDFDNSDEENSDLRLCWHTQETFMFSGYRCGANRPLNESVLWIREVLHR